MKKNLFLTLFFAIVWIGSSTYAQVFSNQSCSTADTICEDREYWHNLDGHLEDCTKPLFYYFYNSVVGSNTLNITSYSSLGSYTLYLLSGSGISFTACEQLEEGNATVISTGSVPTVPGVNVNFSQPGMYVLRLKFNECIMSDAISPEPVPIIAYYLGLADYENITCPEEISEPEFECKDCITSFSPTPGQYMVSAWVKEEGASMTTTTYSNASIEVSFSGDATTFSLLPSGHIIDGWQRIESVVDVPIGATDLHLSMETASGNAYFDDIRFYPLDGSMISYVYDPINLRLMAQLDERNYATFYEYDEEGKLIRVKKETERGVMTIQENRDNIKKQ